MGMRVTITAVSLFCGCGGLDSGFLSRGAKVVEAHDLDPAAIKAYNANHTAVGRVTDLSTTGVRGFAKCDIILAGPPCQGFSTIGSLKPDDSRNALLLSACEIAVSQKPKLVIVENVTGLTTSRNRKIFEAAVTKLSDHGYYVEPILIKAEDVGVPQRRRRVVIIARRGKRPFNVRMPESRQRTVADALQSVVPPDDDVMELPDGSKARLIAQRIGPGQKLCNVRESPASVHTWQIPEVFGSTSHAEQRLLRNLLRLRRTCRKRDFGDADPVSFARICEALQQEDTAETLRTLSEKKYVKVVDGKYDLVHTFNGTYRRLRLDAPSPTVDTHFGNARLFLHPKKHRGLTVSEAAAIQSFSPKFSWPENSQTAFRLIGNAVPPLISDALAQIAEGLL